jgi:hypothetical protein
LSNLNTDAAFGQIVRAVPSSMISQIEPSSSRSPRLARLLAVCQRFIVGAGLLRPLPVPRHPAAACSAAQRRGRGRVRGPPADFVALNSVKLGVAPVSRKSDGGSAAFVVTVAARLLGADVLLLAVKGLEQRLEALALRSDVVKSVLVVADCVGNEVGAAADLFGLACLVAGIEGARAAQGLVDEAIEVVGAAGGRHLETRHEALCVCLAGRTGRLGLGRRKAQDVDLDPFDAHAEVGETGGLEAVVALGDEVVDFALVVVEEGLDVLLVGEGGALGTRHDQVQVEEEADPGIEGDPAKDEVEDILDGGEDGQDNKVDEPGREQGGVGRVQGFVRGEDGEEDGCRDAGQC